MLYVNTLAARFEPFLPEINFHIFMYSFGMKRKTDKDGNKKKLHIKMLNGCKVRFISIEVSLTYFHI